MQTNTGEIRNDGIKLAGEEGERERAREGEKMQPGQRQRIAAYPTGKSVSTNFIRIAASPRAMFYTAGAYAFGSRERSVHRSSFTEIIPQRTETHTRTLVLRHRPNTSVQVQFGTRPIIQ